MENGNLRRINRAGQRSPSLSAVSRAPKAAIRPPFQIVWRHATSAYHAARVAPDRLVGATRALRHTLLTQRIPTHAASRRVAQPAHVRIPEMGLA
jgi:hypothetical protein